MLAQKYPILGSSADPDKVSLTIKSSIPLVILIVGMLKLDIDNTTIETTLLTLGSLISGCFTLFGLGRKIYYQVR